MLRQLGLIFFTFLLFFGLLFIYTKFAGPIPFSVNSITTSKTDSFSVTGEGKASVKPDSATVRVGVNASGATAKEAQDKMNQNINKVIESIKTLGIDTKDIKTENYNVNPNYDYQEGNQSIKGYQANTNIVVKAKDAQIANKILDTATQNGATQVGGVTFDTKDKTAAENEARTKAVKAAKEKAEQAAKIAGFNLGKIINYQENFGGYPGPIAFSADSVRAKGAPAPTQVEPGENEVTVQVTLSYEVR